MTQYGTSYFFSFGSACQYYKDYGYNSNDVERKLKDGEIHIGTPPLKENECLSSGNSEGRYFVIVN
jgi:hypothetical protein